MSDYNDPYEALGLSEESINPTDEFNQSISSGVEIQEGSMESFLDIREKLLTEQPTDNSSMGGITIMSAKPPQIRILSNDGNAYRVYMRSDIQFQPKDINNLCRFLDTRTPNQVVYFILGMDLCVEQSALIGPIVSAIMTCKARTVGMAMGRTCFLLLDLPRQLCGRWRRRPLRVGSGRRAHADADLSPSL